MNTKNASMKVRDFALEVKEVGEGGTFTGYGSVFGVVDSYREIVEPGAFGESLAAIKARGRPVPVLWQHRSGEPIGVYDGLSEDGTGLKVEGRLAIGKVGRADEAHALLAMGAVSGLSIGYYVREDSFDEKERVRKLKRLDLVEVSLVTFPANDDARVDAVKSIISRGEHCSLRQFEGVLRDVGFSKSAAALIAARGYKALLDRGDSNGGIEASDIHAALSAFKLP